MYTVIDWEYQSKHPGAVLELMAYMMTNLGVS